MNRTRWIVWVALAAALAATLLLAQSAGPPSEAGPFRPPDLVELVTMDPTLHLDVRYATEENFVHRRVYPEARAFLQRPAAKALVKAHRWLKRRGFGILVYDGYRPWSVTKVFWDLTAPENRQFVADPSVGSRHNRGCAVDVTLYDLKTGLAAAMPSDYDEASERSYPGYAGGDAAARSRRDLLRAAMEKQGFSVYETEWWHFDHRDWPRYAILDIPFGAISKER
jgi:zinc D-Ala-D-Ala dipeptidase